MTTKKATPKKNPMQGEVPPIDRTAETLEPVAPAEPADVPMPGVVENSPGSVFRPQANVGTLDVMEVTLMYLLELSNSQVQVQPGALRSVALSAARVAQLSEPARRHMQLLAPPAEPAPVPAPTETTH